MAQEAPFKLPINLVLLDGVGAVLLALGLAEHFAGLDVLPTALSFEYRAYVLMAAGIVLMLPLLFFVLNWVRSRSEGRVLK
ncbi:MAG: hypothetical protein CVU15_11905 [Betaproteobacteria bacterium HGW-Betaproteobacteria-1]|jgi:hypothetical protein|nr:MAG: hypothetical protein CVU15_11905 [Betaproteobacteria bacterium HGW-Betaproteobacteria-1]